MVIHMRVDPKINPVGAYLARYRRGGQFLCPICGRPLTRLSNLYKHLRTKHLLGYFLAENEQYIHCRLCGDYHSPYGDDLVLIHICAMHITPTFRLFVNLVEAAHRGKKKILRDWLWRNYPIEAEDAIKSIKWMAVDINDDGANIPEIVVKGSSPEASAICYIMYNPQKDRIVVKNQHTLNQEQRRRELDLIEGGLL